MGLSHLHTVFHKSHKYIDDVNNEHHVFFRFWDLNIKNARVYCCFITGDDCTAMVY